MKILRKRICASTSTDWPFNKMSPDDVFDLIGTDDFEDIWEEYFRNPETRVDNKLQIYVEPSTQHGMGNVYFYDESGRDRFEDISVDFDAWCNKEYELASKSASADDYARKYEAYVKELLGI